MTHTFRSIMNVVRQSPAAQLQQVAPPNRQLTRTETAMLTEQVHGHRQDKPTTLGTADGSDAIQVYATGLYEGIRKGVVRWVTGDKVGAGLTSGVIVQIGQIQPETVIEIETSADHDRAAARDHVPSPPGGMYEPNMPNEPPVPEATATDVTLADMSKADLVAIARNVDLPGRSAMDKSELYEHLRHLPDIASHLPTSE